jgi:putative tricarboxylic transport membrane protein
VNGNRVAGLIFFCAGLYGVVFSFPLLMGSSSQSGAGVFPFSVSLLLVLSGVLWFILGNRRKEERAGIEIQKIISDLATPFKIVVVTLAFVLILSTLGYLIASPLFLLFLFLWVGRFRPWVAVGLAILVGIGSWLFFVKVLAVDLPKGILNL